MKKRYKILLSTVIFILALLLSLPVFIRMMVESKGSKMLHRELSIDGLYINPFSGTIEVSGLRLFDRNKEAGEFVRLAKLSMEVELLELLFGDDIIIASIVLDSPEISIWKKDSIYNFSDLLRPKGERRQKNSGDLYIDHMQMKNGKITFRSDEIGSDSLLAHHIMADVSAFDTKEKRLELTMEAMLNDTATIKANGVYQLLKREYEVQFDLNHLRLKPFLPHLNALINASDLGGHMSCAGTVVGNTNADDFEFHLRNTIVNISKLALVDTFGSTTLVLPEAHIPIDTLDLRRQRYVLGETKIKGIAMSMVLYDTIRSNLSDVFRLYKTKNGDTIAVEPPDPTVLDSLPISKEVYYTVKKISVDSASLFYEDRNLDIPFLFDVRNLSMEMNDISSLQSQIPVSLKADLCDSGRLDMSMVYYPRHPEDFLMNFTIDNLSMSVFSPYLYENMGRRTLSGDLSMESENVVENSKLTSTNDVLVKNFFVSRKGKKTGIINLPLRLALNVLRDMKDNISMKLPLKGDFADPNCRIRRVIGKTLFNIIKKAAITPYSGLMKVFTVKTQVHLEVESNSILSGLSYKDKQNLDRMLYLNETEDGFELNLVQVMPDEEGKRKIKAELAARDAYFRDWDIIPHKEINQVDLMIMQRYLSSAQPDSISLSEEELHELTEAKKERIYEYVALHDIKRDDIHFRVSPEAGENAFEVVLPILTPEELEKRLEKERERLQKEKKTPLEEFFSF